MHFHWLLPNEQGLSPGYEQKTFVDSEKRGYVFVAASEGATARSSFTRMPRFTPRSSIEHALPAERNGWLQVVRGAVDLNGQSLRAGDGAAVNGEPVLTVTGDSDGAEILLFDLP